MTCCDHISDVHEENRDRSVANVLKLFVLIMMAISSCFRAACYPSLTRAMASFSAVQRGAEGTESFRLFFRNGEGTAISPFHDIPLHHNGEKKIFNMVCEVPRFSNAKMEMATKEKLNPIKQDIKKGKLRYVANVFPYHGYLWNYGAIPQTWEDPGKKDARTECNGDNDPIDVCEIGGRVGKRGDIIPVKVLGALAMIDEGETDWKILAIDVNDPLADSLNDISDVEQKMPGLLQATVNWFRIYKIPDGKPPNRFAFDDQFQSAELAHSVIDETHEQWKALVSGGTQSELAVTNVSLGNSATVAGDAAEGIVSGAPEESPAAPIPSSVDEWKFA